jgi:hypothetical protein
MDDKYKGMTVNERLYIAGLIDKFYAATDRKDVGEVLEILRHVELTREDSIFPILKSLNLPIKYK